MGMCTMFSRGLEVYDSCSTVKVKRLLSGYLNLNKVLLVDNIPFDSSLCFAALSFLSPSPLQ